MKPLILVFDWIVAIWAWIKELFARCKHEHLRCIHGDEINATARMWRKPEIARAACSTCGRYIYNRGLPEPCTVTGASHDHHNP